MKSIKKELIVFILIAAFVVAGVCSVSYFKLYLLNAYDVIRGKTDVSNAINNVNGNADIELSYHSAIMDFQSLIMRKTGTCYVKKEDGFIGIASNGMLGQEAAKLSDDDVKAYTKAVKALKKEANDSGADFLYVYAPEKSSCLELPAPVENYSQDNYERFSAELKRNQIDVLDLKEQMKKENISAEDMFFITDHHWKPEYGFWAYSNICKELNQRYGFEYNKEYTDLKNYKIKEYDDWFLGSYGKKVGRYFSPLGVDDFALITPSFKTLLSEEQPFKKEAKNGSFTDTVMDMNMLKTKDLYGINAYAAYTGGDFRLQIVKNELSNNDSRILVVRDSYACVVTPFLALNCKELYITDVRNYAYYIGEKLNLADYIKEIKPDYVVVLYGSIPYGDSVGNFDFF